MFTWLSWYLALSYISQGQTTEIISGALLIWPMVNGSKVNISAPVYQRSMGRTTLVTAILHVCPTCYFHALLNQSHMYRKVDKAIYLFFWKFSLQNLGKSPKSLHTTSEWMNSNCHSLFSLCPLFHFCWKWGVRHSLSFAIPQLSPNVQLIFVYIQRTTQTSFRIFLQTRIIVDGAKFNSHDSGGHF